MYIRQTNRLLQEETDGNVQMQDKSSIWKRVVFLASYLCAL
jgi:hypothetical protein